MAMEEFEMYKSQLEVKFNKPMKEIIFEYYITKDLGPSVGARELEIPRRVFIYFRNYYGLKEIKHAIMAEQNICPDK